MSKTHGAEREQKQDQTNASKYRKTTNEDDKTVMRITKGTKVRIVGLDIESMSNTMGLLRNIECYSTDNTITFPAT